MAFKLGLLFLAVLVGSNAFPIEKEQDMSMFFDQNDPDTRIVGGSPAGNVNYMVALVTGTSVRTFSCGAGIVTQRHVLTAAHCLPSLGGNNIRANVRGIVGTNRWNSGGIALPFARGLMHPNYNANTIKNDIAIITTSANIPLGGNVQRLTINYDWVGGGVATRTTGWGRTATGGSLSAVLLELRASVVDGNRCVNDVRNRAAQLNMRVPHVDPAIEICTFLAANRGTCHGDSGSPLMRSDRNQQIGVVSWGLPCARGAPDMFVRVSAYRAWIQNNTR